MERLEVKGASHFAGWKKLMPPAPEMSPDEEQPADARSIPHGATL